MDLKDTKNVLFLTSRMINPVLDGRKATLKQMIHQISEDGAKVFLCAMVSKEDYLVKQPDEIVRSLRLNPTTTFQKVRGVLIHTIFCHWMIQNSVYYLKKNQKLLDKFMEENEINIVVCDSDRMAEYLLKSRYHRAKKYLDMDDRVTITLRGQIKSKINENIYGNFRSQMPKFLLFFFSFFHLEKLIMRIEFHLAKKFEKRAPHLFDKIFLVSPNEVEAYKKETKQGNIFCMPVAVDFDYFSHGRIPCEKSSQICFLGSLKILHNQITLTRLMDNVIVPLSKKRTFSVLAVGNCDESTRALFSKYGSLLEMTGPVDDIRPFCKRCFCMAAPISFGSGIKIKILESMAMGVPVVTTRVGISGICATDKKDYLLADTDEEMMKSIVLLADDPVFRMKVSSSASEFIEKNHTYEATSAVIREAILL